MPEWTLPVTVGVAPVAPPIPHQQRSATPKPSACKRMAAVPGASRLQAPRGGPRWSGEGDPIFSSIHFPHTLLRPGRKKEGVWPGAQQPCSNLEKCFEVQRNPPTTDNVSFGSEPEPQPSDD
ncbi:hypothetical protein ACCO45_005920 [Purpureocillium lilacinum]|uniref:Uncharacterized protein n=1 Tax=Purpureocillium lilacinum TaxID=33203 RepID=A0ACC4DZU9_PURLI